MCGIAGNFNSDGRPVDPALLSRMAAALGHRGPDERGWHADGPLGLANARLSIIDVAGGHQPMANRDRSIWITYNGEIFNYVELRADLERKGHQFTTHSDTEVILHLYEEMGEECVHAFNGQWAFAIWDSRRARLFVSRDRLGVRPLFYASRPDRFVFASEIKAVLCCPGVSRELDLKALDQIFTFWAPIAPRTIFKHVSELPPGHSMTVDETGCRTYAYWTPEFDQVSENGDTEKDTEKDAARCADELLDLLVDATRLRLRSDVPVGAYLSGGLDSSVITAIATRLTGARLRTFSVSFDDPEFDEREHQDAVVASLGTEHTRVPCSAADIARVFPDVVWHAERPILRTAPAPMYMLSRLVRDNGYKVVLTGEGSDELLGGYDIFKEAKIRAFWAAQPESSRRPLLLKRLYPYLANVQAQSDAFLRGFFRVQDGPASCFFSHLPRWQMTARLKLLFSSDVRAELADYDAYEDLKQTLPAGFSGSHWFARAQHLEATGLLPGYILSSQGDRMSMAHGVEGRFPFLDHRVVAFTSALPASLKMKVLNEKYLLKRASGTLVPETIRKRSKQPYRAPGAACFVPPDGRRSPEYVHTLLASSRVSEDGIFNPTAVSQLVSKTRTGGTIGVRDDMGLVGVLSTQLLIDRFIRQVA
jgi:asparagine synthase (glutamine-hydrolysing)